MTRIFLRFIQLSCLIVAVAMLGTFVVMDVDDTIARNNEGYRSQAAAVAAALIGSSEEEAVQRVVARTPAGKVGRLAVHLPGGQLIGTSKIGDAFIRDIAFGGTPTTVQVAGEDAYLLPVALERGGTAVVEIRLPGDWFSSALGGRFIALLIAAVLATAIAVGIARLRIRPIGNAARQLAETAESLRPGAAVVDLPRAPRELRLIAAALDGISRRWAKLHTEERTLLADLSHRLRTPLTALRLDAEALPPGKIADRITRSLSLLEDEINGVIAGSEPKLADTDDQADVRAVIGKRMEFWKTLAEGQERECTVDCAGTPALVATSPADLVGVLDAMMVNVYRYTPRGAPVAISVVNHAGWVTLVIDDGGPGIADPGAALRRGSSSGGSTGLGLDIARGYAESTGGSIHVERGKLGGARIRLRLPEIGTKYDKNGEHSWRLGRHELVWRSAD